MKRVRADGRTRSSALDAEDCELTSPRPPRERLLRRRVLQVLAEVAGAFDVAVGACRVRAPVSFCRWAGCVWMNSSLIVGICRSVDQPQVHAHAHAGKQVHASLRS